MTQQNATQTLPNRLRIYSHHPAEQAAYEIAHYWLRKMEQRLAEEPGNVMTLGRIYGHVYWLIDGHLVSSLDAGAKKNPLTPTDADNYFPEECIEGIGAGDLLDLADEAKAWVENPSFMKLPDDHYMGHFMHGEPSTDTRVVGAIAHPHRQHGITGYIDVIVDDDETLISIDGEPCDITLTKPMLAMIAGGGYVEHITMRVPQLDTVGRPSCFDRLDETSVLNHLCYGTGFSPLNGYVRTATWEVLPSNDGTIALEYTLSLPPTIVNTLKHLA